MKPTKARTLALIMRPVAMTTQDRPSVGNSAVESTAHTAPNANPGANIHSVTESSKAM
jgi:hypothetical protein